MSASSGISRRTLLGITTAVLIATSAALLVVRYSRRNDPPPIAFDLYAAIGRMTGEQTAQLLGSRGEVLLVLSQTGGPDGMLVNHTRSSFETAARKQGLRIAGAVIVPADKLRYESGTPIDRETFLAAMAAYPNVAAFVSLIGAPALKAEDAAALGGRKMVVAASASDGLPRLFQSGLLHLAVLPGYGQSEPAVRVVTPQNASTLAAEVAGGREE